VIKENVDIVPPNRFPSTCCCKRSKDGKVGAAPGPARLSP
jgi:hypothetical protein